MPFKSDKQRKWMYANDREMAKKWETEEAIRGKLRDVIKQEIKESKILRAKQMVLLPDKKMYFDPMSNHLWLMGPYGGPDLDDDPIEPRDRDYNKIIRKLSSKDKSVLKKAMRTRKRRKEATTSVGVPGYLSPYSFKKSTQTAIDIDDEDDEKNESINEGWWEDLSDKAQKSYIKKHGAAPNSSSPEPIGKYKKGDITKQVQSDKGREIAKDMAGNMTGAVKKIEKIKKGLSDDPKVKAALRKANESINEGKWSKIMRSVRKGSKSGPWSIVVYKNKKVKHQRLVKILQQIPAHYEDVKKKYPRDKIGIDDKYGERVYTESIDEYKKFRGKMTYGGGKPKKGDYVKIMIGVIAQIEKIRGSIAFMKLPGEKTKGYWMNDLKNLKPTDKMEKGKTLWTESVNESDLGLTYKKGKTVKVTHKKSGKELIIIDKPNVKREYEKIGYFTEGTVNELQMAPFSSQEARSHINSDIKDMSKLLGKTSQKVIKIMMDGVKGGKYTAMDISRGIKEGPAQRTHFGEMTFIQSLWTKMREKFRKYSKDRKLS